MRKLRMGMVGGGLDSFMGDVHRKASALDGMIELVCGAFNSTLEKTKATGKAFFLPENRCYGSFQEMILKEKELPEGERMDFVTIVTPNFLHFQPAKMALENGFHVVCDKPVTLTVNEAQILEKLVNDTSLLFALTHNYTGNAMVKQAKQMVENGELGTIRKIQVQYLQGWMAAEVDKEAKIKPWRADPKKSGVGGSLADIGTHAENLVSYITGLQITEIAADLGRIGKDRVLDNDGNILLRMENGAKGTMSISQMAVGEENALGIKIYGSKGSIEWNQEEATKLTAKWIDKPEQTFTPDGNDIYKNVREISRIPKGHPEGYLEAFANIYKAFGTHLMSVLENNPMEKPDYPSINDGVKGVEFIYAAVESDKQNAAWVKLK
ncbi:Gfo/Idh/MocA family protein [Galbibacter pacificus]|uniref:Gfo/Idh/MocA family oxidoreductase n=1 Tax=Galbibacter pacificus TaxID=2996052 RepID=A0ABT6FSD4_9FLAO|nr:Gfo/Idh/MocA family oxidoreductase [Galbibacter pacificus]MDG3582698.1 Gfo/Idh/MocA family oxidoreductase [Galbibacter pacificus]MDG3586183.1 Gfo/Idh/MocA family oxidoreductase [Galbibacter pacificus]